MLQNLETPGLSRRVDSTALVVLIRCFATSSRSDIAHKFCSLATETRKHFV